MLVGYGTEVKGYRFFDPGRSKVFYSRDVKFNELEFGLKECRDVEPIGYFKVVNDSDVLEELVLKRPCLIKWSLRQNLEGLSCGTFELLRKMAGIVSLPVSFSEQVRRNVENY